MKNSSHCSLKSNTAVCPFASIQSISNKIIYYILQQLAKKFIGKTPTRAFHAKTIGLAEAKIKIEGDILDTISSNLQIGLFATAGKEYEAWIRFTNGSGSIQNDDKKDARGMAIKILNDQTDNGVWDEHDIVMFNAPIFIPAKAAWQLMGVKTVLGNFLQLAFWGLILIVRFCPKSIWFFKHAPIKTPNILEESYYSVTPYSFGKRAIKWHVRPLKLITDVMPDKPDKNFLRERLAKDLYKHVSFALYVQFQENGETEPIEDTSVEWKTNFQKVATITLIPQDILSTERESKDLYTSFSPGRTHPEHKPLGSINLIRKRVYEHLAKQRMGSI